MSETKSLDYVKLWTTLMRMGINQRFSQIRSEFFMRIATDGPKKFKGDDDLWGIIDKSPVITSIDGFRDRVAFMLAPEDEFKHYYYEDDGQKFIIEYFANVSQGLRKEFIDFIKEKDIKLSDASECDIDAYCYSVAIKRDKKPSQEEEDDEEETDDYTKDVVTVHLILIGEGSESVTPDNYPEIIKHELTHACLFEIGTIAKLGYYDTVKVPATWTDDDIKQWREDVAEVIRVLYTKSPECTGFVEFIGDFLMYESDGQTKEKNPIVESRVPRTTKSDAKPKVTYRTLSPLDRFEEHLDVVNDLLRNQFQEIVNALRPVYDKYDEFIDAVKM